MEELSLTDRPLPAAGLFHLSVVYVVWSSTYLAIRIAVQEGSGLTPFAMGAMRMAAASVLLFLLAYVQKQTILPKKGELKILAISSALLWVGGNGLVMWAEQHANSGFAALMVASSPIWTACLEAVIDHKKPSLLLISSLLLGFVGSGVLMAPSLVSWNPTEISANIALVIASISWSLGSYYQTRNTVSLSAPVSSAYQHLFACAGFTLLTLALGEPTPHPTPHAWMALGYLVLFGSIFAFTSFVYTLRLLPLNIAMTYAYVNPALALLLGWFLLNEPISLWTVLGALMVILGVIGVFKAKDPQKTTA